MQGNVAAGVLVVAMCALVFGWVGRLPWLMVAAVLVLIAVFVGFGRHMRVDREHGRDRPWRDRGQADG
ncbi:hypothetical protein SGFS_013050 [Streptomyces graminofaciens]|uniref:Uncharacterized protein n=1 Tax=Streptomyces graminofaciens TaxID=68212 RepID=A0ABM7F2J7_9ACTN|nr:hypothetical protein SGFS_013050 [Streptomyces graminofaciens]